VLLLAAKVGALTHQKYTAQGLGYACAVARFLYEILGYPVPLLLTVLVSNGTQFMVIKALFLNMDMCIPNPDALPHDQRNYYGVSDIYELFTGSVLNKPAARAWKYYCSSHVVLATHLLSQPNTMFDKESVQLSQVILDEFKCSRQVYMYRHS